MTAKQWEEYLSEHEAKMLKQNEQDRKPFKRSLEAFGNAWIWSVQNPLGRLGSISGCLLQDFKRLNFWI
jgi:hypothetical protein